MTEGERLYPRPFGHTIFCDDLRLEVDGKISLIGVYTGGMNVGAAFPVAIPKFAIFVTYHERMLAPLEPITVKILMEREEGVDVLYEQSVDLTEAKTKGPELASPVALDERLSATAFNVQFAPLVIPGRCALKVRAYRGGEEIRLGALQIEGRVAEASGLPVTESIGTGPPVTSG